MKKSSGSGCPSQAPSTGCSGPEMPSEATKHRYRPGNRFRHCRRSGIEFVHEDVLFDRCWFAGCECLFACPYFGEREA